MTFRVNEAFTASKTGDDHDNEDIFTDGPHWTVVCDGASDRSGFRLDGRTGGWHTSRIIADVCADAPARTNPAVLLEQIARAYAQTLNHLIDPDSGDRPSAVFAAFDKSTGTMVRVGDVTWFDGTHMFEVQNKVEAVHVAMRSTYLRMLLADGATETDLLASDPARAIIAPSLRREATLRNRTDVGDLAFAAVDGLPVPARFVETWVVGPDVSEVVIASDGYPRVFATLAETEEYLHADLQRDPLRIGAHAGTKAPGPGFVSFDDRTYVRLTRDASGLPPYT